VIAAIYLRISQDQAGDSAGVTRQGEDCRALADELGWQVGEIYVDNDVSATTTKPRPSYQRMLVDIRHGRVNAIIAWHTDRLYRRLADLEELAKVCEDFGLAVRTCRSGELDMSTPTGRMIARILGSVAQFEVEQKADRWLRSVRQRREAGRWWNSANRMFGYTRDGRIVEREADALRRASAEILAGGTIFSACRLLQGEGWRTTRGNDWQPTSLRATLRSPKIAGLSALDGQIIGPGSWEPILDRETWERVVARLAPRNQQGPKPRRALLTRLVFCGVEGCGRQLYRAVARDRVYRCQTELKVNGHVTIAAKPLEEMVEAAARAKLSDERIRRAVAARLAGADSRAAELTAEIDNIETEIHELECVLRDAGDRSKLAIVRAIDDLDARLAAKRSQLGALTPVLVPANDNEWPDDIDRRAALIGLVVARIVVLPAKRLGGRFDHERVRILPVQADSQLEADQL
jgi:DNA invertase Pin-like site-specific DNA recombinase